MMVEVPAAAIAIERFDADFFSIGSNDLTQYVMAAARDNSAVADLNRSHGSGGVAADRAGCSPRRGDASHDKPLR